MMRIITAAALLMLILAPAAAADPEPVEYGTSPVYVRVNAQPVCVTVTPEAFPFVIVDPDC